MRNLRLSALGLLVLLSLPGVAVAQPFERGNCNGDCAFDISDPIFLAQLLFQGGTPSSCFDACDANDDGIANIADIVSIVMALFGNPSAPLPPPYGGCGLDPTPDALDCATEACVGQDLAPSGLTAVVVGNVVQLDWTNANPCLGLTTFRLLRTLNVPPTGPTDPSAVVVFEGSASSAQDSLLGLLPNTPASPRTYFYRGYSCDAGGSCSGGTDAVGVSPTLIECMAAGGYTVYMRHALATTCSDRTDLGPAASTTVPGWWLTCDSDCATTTARQLDPAGVVQAMAVGAYMTARGLIFGRVLSSEFCRCVTTADLLGFGPTTETNQGITFFVYDEPQRCVNALMLLGEMPAPGTNTIMVGHVGMTCDVLGTLSPAESAIYKPDGQGSLVFVERVLSNAWLGLP